MAVCVAMQLFLAFTSLVAVPGLTAVPGDKDPLERLYDKSSLVVAGTVASRPWGSSLEIGVVNYYFTISVSESLKGKPKEANLYVCVEHFEFEEGDSLPYLKENAKVILFLRSDLPNKPKWKTSDPWFGIQPYNLLMARKLKAWTEKVQE